MFESGIYAELDSRFRGNDSIAVKKIYSYGYA